ncbi:MAG: flagellar basal body P-ring protein FlgI [Planctomycetes bacterium]|nr:flagellar basal body P-ring protein FlgI [Planctomycetota bacterium]
MRTICTTLLFSLVCAPSFAQEIKVPIRSLTRLHGAMNNTITGIGIVTGLNKTGSGDRTTRQATANFIKRHGLKVSDSDLTSGSVALVSVSAELPPFAHVGRTISVSVKSLGDATSLEGGFLEPVELEYYDGPNSVVYATAAGTVTTGGFGASSKTATITRNNPTSGIVTRGAKVVRELSPELLSEAGDLQLNLMSPSLRTAHNIAAGIDRVLGDSGVSAFVQDEALVRIVLPEEQRNRQQVLRALSLIRDIEVAVEHPNKVVVHLDTGTIIAGAGVQISPCVIAMSDLTISVVSEEEVIQPPPGIHNPGTTERVDRSLVDIAKNDRPLVPLKGGGATVEQLASNLQALQLEPRQLIEVFKNLDAGGYLHAPLEMR